MRQKFTIEPTIKVGDLLTSVSILLTLVGLLIAWSHERQSQNRVQADKSRQAAAVTLAKLERLRELSLWYYEEVKPLFVQASEELAKNKGGVITTRDALWRQLDEARGRAIDKIHEEKIEQSYVELYGYYPQAYDIITAAINKLKDRDEALFLEFQEKTQGDIFAFANEGRTELKPGYQSADLGNRLRGTSSSYKEKLKAEIDQILEEPRNFVLSIVQAPDDEILRRAADGNPNSKILSAR